MDFHAVVGGSDDESAGVIHAASLNRAIDTVLDRLGPAGKIGSLRITCSVAFLSAAQLARLRGRFDTGAYVQIALRGPSHPTIVESDATAGFQGGFGGNFAGRFAAAGFQGGGNFEGAPGSGSEAIAALGGLSVAQLSTLLRVRVVLV